VAILDSQGSSGDAGVPAAAAPTAAPTQATHSGIGCLREAGDADADVAVVVDSASAIDWTAVAMGTFPPVLVLPHSAGLPDLNETDPDEQLTVSLAETASPTPVPAPPQISPTVVFTNAPQRTQRGTSQNRVVIFVAFCIACFFVSSLYCRTRNVQAQNNAALRRSMWLVSLLENETTTQQRLQVQLRTETAGRIFASLPVRTVGEPDPDDPARTVVVSPDDCCCICIDEYDKGDKIAKLPCGHEFHSDCIAPWLEQQCTCPLCKRDLLEGTDEDPNAFLDNPNNAPDGWRAFLEQLLENQYEAAIVASREGLEDPEDLERPTAPEPGDGGQNAGFVAAGTDGAPGPLGAHSDDMHDDYFLVDFEEEATTSGPPTQPAAVLDI
jgi:hypothetical protein